MNRSVRHRPGASASEPSQETARDSRARTTVVPTAITSRPPRRAAEIAAAAGRLSAADSACMRWSSRRSVRIGWNVPAPTCRVTRWTSIPRARIFPRSSGVRCSPAVGAAAEPNSRAYTVW